ncbi:MAG: Asp-tRNA(Asn)/Glu-tRNA(Gln) amidotransferase subunit GatC [Patescibacteria group bacterium]
MSKITKDDVMKLAVLARLSLNDDEIEKYQRDLESILGFIDQLDDIDVSQYEPTEQVTGLENVTRADEVTESTDQKDLLKNAPDSKDGQFKVRRVL